MFVKTVLKELVASEQMKLAEDVLRDVQHGIAHLSCVSVVFLVVSMPGSLVQIRADVLVTGQSCSGRVSGGIPKMCVNPAVSVWLLDYSMPSTSFCYYRTNTNFRKAKT